MKILLLHQFFVLDSEPGGTRHIFLSRFFQKSGGEVKVIAGGVNYMTGKSRLPFYRPWMRENVDGIDITWVYALPTLKYGVLGKLASYFSFFFFASFVFFAQKADVLIATTPPPTVAILGWLFHRLKRIPWVLEVRDLWPEMILDSGLKIGLGTAFLERLMNFLYKSANFLVLLTPGLLRSILEKGVNQEKAELITNGVDPIFLTDHKVFPQIEKRDKFWVLYLGAMGKPHALDNLIEAAKLLKSNQEIQFVFVGNGTEKKRLMQIVAQDGLSNILFFDPVSRKEVPGLLSLADLCISSYAARSSFRSGLPNRFFDYLAGGKPVLLCMEKGDASEILEESRGGIRVDPEDSEGIAKAILNFFHHPEMRSDMGEAGRSYVMRHFLRENLAKHYFMLISRLAAGGRKEIFE